MPRLLLNRAAADIMLDFFSSRLAPLSGEPLQYIRLLPQVDWDDIFEERGFSELHKIVCGLSDKDLIWEARAHPGDLNTVTSAGRTPLCLAGLLGKENDIRILLDHGALLDSDHGLRPIDAFFFSRKPQCLEVLLDAGIRITREDVLDGWWPLVSPNSIRPINYTSIIDSILAVDRLLLDQDFDINIQDRGFIPLMCRIGPYVARLKLLLDRGAKTELVDMNGMTAILHSVSRVNPDAFEVLAKYGARLNVKDCGGSTILHVVVRQVPEFYEPYRQFIQAMMKVNLRGLDLDARDSDGFTAFQLLRYEWIELHLLICESEGWDISGALSKLDISDLVSDARLESGITTYKDLKDSLFNKTYRRWSRLGRNPIYCIGAREAILRNVQAVERLLHWIQESKGIPTEARYPALDTTVRQLEDLLSRREVTCAPPGAWPE